MTKTDKHLLIVLYGAFILLLLAMAHPYVGLHLLDRLIVSAFYTLALTVPLYFFIQLIRQRTLKAFTNLIFAGLPALIYAVIMIVLLIQLSRALEHF